MANADGLVRWPLKHRAGEAITLTLTPRLASDHFAILQGAALNHLGLTYLPERYCRDELKAGSLVPVLPDRTKPSATIQAVYLSRRGLLPSVRAFIDYLAKHWHAERGEGVSSNPEPLATEGGVMDPVAG